MPIPCTGVLLFFPPNNFGAIKQCTSFTIPARSALSFSTETLRMWAVVAMILSIATYFWRLHPTIKKLDAMGCITPKGYSKALGWMISGFMGMFTLALIVHIITKVM